MFFAHKIQSQWTSGICKLY